MFSFSFRKTRLGRKKKINKNKRRKKKEKLSKHSQNV
jgi:hypothetical protein